MIFPIKALNGHLLLTTATSFGGDGFLADPLLGRELLRFDSGNRLLNLRILGGL